MIVFSTYLYSIKFLSDLILYSEKTKTEDAPVKPGDGRRDNNSIVKTKNI